MKNNLKNLIVLPEIDSTNNYANRLISAQSVANGTVVLAHYQQKGRGQRENQWESAPGMNLLASLIVYPSRLPARKQFYLSKVASLALVHWLKEKNVEVTIKWPNDIYAGNQKIAGILIETSIKGSDLYAAMVGIGLNLNQTEFSSHLPNPVSLKMLTGVESNLSEAALELRDIFMKLFFLLEAGKWEPIDTAYFSRLFRVGQWAWFREKGRLLEARITGIGEYGQLLLEDRAGHIHTYVFKEVEFIL